MPKVLLIQSRFVIGGPSQQNLLIAEELIKNGFEVILVSGAGDTKEKLVISESEHPHLDFRIIYEMGRNVHFYDDFISLYKLVRLIASEKPDIVHTHTAKAGAIGRLAAWLMRVPVVIHTFHGHIFHSYFGKFVSRIFIELERMFAWLSDIIIVLSPSQYQDIVFNYRISRPGKTRIIRLGFRFSKDVSPEPGQMVWEKYKIDRQQAIIITVGRFVPIKNIRQVIRVSRWFKDNSEIPVHFLLVGDGELRNEIQEEIFKNGLEKSVTITGWVNDLAKIYQSASMLLLTSHNEGTPVTIIEAGSWALPVVATAVGGVPDMITDGENGFLVAPENDSQMIEKINFLLRDERLRKRIGMNGRNRVLREYGIETLVRNITDLYSTLLEKKRQ